MPSAIHLAVVAAGLINLHQASAVPTPDLHPRSSITLTQVKNDKFVANGVAARAKAYSKYHGTLPADLVQAIGQSGSKFQTFVLTSGSAPATPADIYDSEYLVPVSIGTPAKTFNLDLDTGSSDLWVFGPEVSAATSNHTIYNPSASSSSSTTQDNWKISYGDGSSASGNVYKDTVSLGGVLTSHQAVEQATQASAQFIQTSGDGLMGLAFESINTCTPRKQTPFWQTASSSLSQQVFVADLRYHKGGCFLHLSHRGAIRISIANALQPARTPLEASLLTQGQ
jgi:Eukaryotic aspartyl protease